MDHVRATESENSDLPFKILNPSVFQPQEEDEECFGIENMTLSLKPGEEVEANTSSGTGKIRHTKLCARGHWRPAEDGKLKELVAQFGPQNWNSIAEHLQGRSGKFQFFFLFEIYFFLVNSFFFFCVKKLFLISWCNKNNLLFFFLQF